ncbi:MAG: cytochrome c3 family protein [Marinobacter sp.]|nr:cytochrome c3 family protein [Marinobacter sp.]
MAKSAVWFLWVLASLALASVLGYELLAQPQKPHFLPGESTVGHYQIELSCGTCHTESFSDREAIQAACMDCHGDELKAVRDSHPKSKFTDPRNANRLANIDARYCAACHTEHALEITNDMGVTQPKDFCLHCHQDIAEDRPSHEGMAFDTCASSGCHNYHDNQALYEDFLLAHAHEPDLLSEPGMPTDGLARMMALAGIEAQPFDGRKPVEVDSDTWQDVHAEWSASAHGEANVGCQNCHQPEDNASWNNHPDTSVCGTCHQQEQAGFLAGKHGMRLAQELSAMTPRQARQPMKESAAHRELTCNSCHAPHRQDTVAAAVDACVGCHDDEHTLAFEGSPHHQTWTDFLAGGRPREQAVSCASCHLPRLESQYQGEAVILVQHNQNATLRPNEKMVRGTCLNCHGLEFSLDALASPELIRSNFSGPPEHHVPSIDMALARENPGVIQPGTTQEQLPNSDKTQKGERP